MHVARSSFFFMRGGGGGGELTQISQAFTHRRHLEGRTLEANNDLPTSQSVVVSEKKKRSNCAIRPNHLPTGRA